MKEIWANKRYRSMIILGLWMIFIIFIFILSSFSRSNGETITKQPEQEKEITIKELLSEFQKSSNSVTYEMVITENETKKILEGTYAFNEYSGYLTTTTEVISYRCENSLCYKIFIDHEEPMDTYLFEGIKDPLYVTKFADNLVLQEETEPQKIYKYSESSLDGIIEYVIVVAKKVVDEEENYQISQINISSPNLKVETRISLEPLQTLDPLTEPRY